MKQIENPIQHFADAAEAATRYLSARREHFVITAELRAKREAKRAAWGAAGVAFANLALLLVCLWITVGLHERGLSAGAVAWICLFVLGGAAGACFAFSKRMTAPDKPQAETSARRAA